MFDKSVTIVAGHFGSGKTEICINGAITLVEQGEKVALVDLDVVKPYFRARSARWILRELGVKLVAPEGENVYADLPILVPAVRALCRRRDRCVIMDAGGDDTGSRVVGSLSDVLKERETDFYLVVNFRRPFTPDVDSAVSMALEIQRAARLPFTGVLSNTHLLAETTGEVVWRGYELAQETAKRLATNVLGVFVEEHLREQLQDREFGCPLFSLRRFIRPPFEGSLKQRTQGPLFAVG